VTIRVVYIKIAKNFPDPITFLYKKIRRSILDHTIYHIYENGECIYPCLSESEFNKKWAELEGRDNITFERLPEEQRKGGVGSFDDNLEPSY